MRGEFYDKTINARTPDPQHHISQAVLRRYIVAYGAPAIESTLNLLNYRRNIIKPAGFFLTVLRSENRQTLMAESS